MENIASNDSLINRLPDDCLAHIFSFLPISERLRVERVCKHWRIICERGWNDLDVLRIDWRYSNNMILSILKRGGRFLRKLQISLSSKNFTCLSMITEFCRFDQLENFKIFVSDDYNRRQAAFITRSLKEIFEKFRNLVAVTISGHIKSNGIDLLNFLNPKVLRKLLLVNGTDKTLSVNVDRFPNLKELTLRFIENIRDEIRREEENLKGLEKLEITGCYIPKNFMKRIETFTNLQKLTLENNVGNISNEHIRGLARHCHQIKDMSLSVSDPSRITHDCFKYLGKMPSLKVLELENFKNVNNLDIIYLRNVRKLTFCYCEGIVSGHGMIELIANSSSLEELELQYIYDMSKVFLNNVKRIFHHGQRKKQLTLTVAGSCFDENFVTEVVTDHPLLALTNDDDD